MPRSGTVYTVRDSPFFRLRTRAKLAKLLHISSEALKAISLRDDLYVRRWKHKKDEIWLSQAPSIEQSQFFRPIDIPDPGLKAIQARIALLLSRITPPPWLFSPVKGRSYVGNAARHTSARAFWLLDIADYFPSCSERKVAYFFSKKLECSADVTAILVKLTTWEGCVPQGSPSSPILAYFSNVDMWEEIAETVANAGLTHSVYADDLTVSGALVRKETIWRIKQTIHKHGLRIRADKELSLIEAPADITGVIVSDGKTKLPNRQLKRLFELKQQRHSARSTVLQRALDQKIAGRLAQKRQVEQHPTP